MRLSKKWHGKADAISGKTVPQGRRRPLPRKRKHIHHLKRNGRGGKRKSWPLKRKKKRRIVHRDGENAAAVREKPPERMTTSFPGKSLPLQRKKRAPGGKKANAAKTGE